MNEIHETTVEGFKAFEESLFEILFFDKIHELSKLKPNRIIQKNQSSMKKLVICGQIGSLEKFSLLLP